MDASQENTPEIDLVDLAKKVWHRRKFILKYCIIGAVIGLVVGFSVPSEYTSRVKMAPEDQRNRSIGQVAGLAAMAGFDIGDIDKDGLSATIYPEIVKSTPFLVELSQIPVEGMKHAVPVFLYEYMERDLSLPWWSYVIRAPFKLIGWIFEGKKNESPATINPRILSRKQSRILKAIDEQIELVSDKKTGVLSVFVTFQDPRVAATVADSLVRKLENYMIAYRTEKAKRDLEFLQRMHEESRDNYYLAQKRYAQLMDATQNVGLQSAKIEQEKLRNEQQIAYEVYNHIAQQLETAKIKVQEATPVVTIIEPAGVPPQKSSAGKSTYLIIFTFLAGALAVGVVIFKGMFGRAFGGTTSPSSGK